MSYNQLTSKQRYTISILLQNGNSKKEIAELIKVSPSTISREIKRNSSPRGIYQWDTAQKNADYHKHRCPGNHAIKPEIIEKAKFFLTEKQWSPAQISGYLAQNQILISHETIYKLIRQDKRDGGKLYLNCRHKLKHRRHPIGGKRVIIPNRVGIEKRPPEADGTRFGDLEMDTIVGKNNRGAIVTLVDRKTGFLWMRKLRNGKNARDLARTVVQLLKPFKGRIKTITTDNGCEFACHEMIAKRLGVTVYFADPYASWQKGAIENTNGLIRQFIPKSASFSDFSHRKIAKIMKNINTRPRKKLNFLTPEYCLFNEL